ncbi:hypothetical protein RB614_26735 [Phytohabitans sp. ZYX-F-186]|uniref:BP74 N-terminal domain-containing protein n=1 Tax=Phytohabitans maris TaxID=3071409 RepID=A0ABU0ZM67_9ACTN|nr:hypothetical protein [Phytohabitans sp. ZYX-F-186]MDQ7908128.1 hypothetical protein [Phytohabitans sp. ZYX-F-186]
MRARLTAVLSALALAAVAVPATPAAAATAGEYVATIQVGEGGNVEQFRIHLVEAADVTAAFASLNQQSDQFPNGLIVRTGPEVNVGYSWHIDPGDVEFVDLAVEVCDGLPSDVENGTLTSDRYCPWSGRVVAMTPLP